MSIDCRDNVVLFVANVEEGTADMGWEPCDFDIRWLYDLIDELCLESNYQMVRGDAENKDNIVEQIRVKIAESAADSVALAVKLDKYMKETRRWHTQLYVNNSMWLYNMVNGESGMRRSLLYNIYPTDRIARYGDINQPFVIDESIGVERHFCWETPEVEIHAEADFELWGNVSDPAYIKGTEDGRICFFGTFDPVSDVVNQIILHDYWVGIQEDAGCGLDDWQPLMELEDGYIGFTNSGATVQADVTASVACASSCLNDSASSSDASLFAISRSVTASLSLLSSASAKACCNNSSVVALESCDTTSNALPNSSSDIFEFSRAWLKNSTCTPNVLSMGRVTPAASIVSFNAPTLRFVSIVPLMDSAAYSAIAPFNSNQPFFAGANACPICTFRASVCAAVRRSASAIVPLNCSAASLVAPVESFNSARVAEYSAAPSLARTVAARLPSMRPNNVWNSMPVVLAICPTTVNASLRSLPAAINSLNDCPVRFSNSLDICEAGSARATRAERICVIACAVGVPVAVISAIAAPMSANPTPKSAASGVT